MICFFAYAFFFFLTSAMRGMEGENNNNQIQDPSELLIRSAQNGIPTYYKSHKVISHYPIKGFEFDENFTVVSTQGKIDSYRQGESKPFFSFVHDYILNCALYNGPEKLLVILPTSARCIDLKSAHFADFAVYTKKQASSRLVVIPPDRSLGVFLNSYGLQKGTLYDVNTHQMSGEVELPKNIDCNTEVMRIIDRRSCLLADTDGTMYLSHSDKDKNETFSGHSGKVLNITLDKINGFFSLGSDNTIRKWLYDGSCLKIILLPEPMIPRLFIENEESLLFGQNNLYILNFSNNEFRYFTLPPLGINNRVLYSGNRSVIVDDGNIFLIVNKIWQALKIIQHKREKEITNIQFSLSSDSDFSPIGVVENYNVLTIYRPLSPNQLSFLESVQNVIKLSQDIPTKIGFIQYLLNNGYSVLTTEGKHYFEQLIAQWIRGDIS